MRSTLFYLPVLTTIFACGPGQPEETASDTELTTTSTGGTTTDPGTTSTTSATTTSATTSTVTTEANPTTGVATDVTTGFVTTDASDPSADTSATTDGPPDIVYAAQFWSGGLDHLTVREADFKGDLCISVHFARPGGSPTPGLVLPTDWWFSGATISQGSADCLDFEAAMPEFVGASGISGVGAWDADAFCPATIELELVLDFPPDQPWVPVSDALSVTGLPVQGC